MINNDVVIWLDIETTGLEEGDDIWEIAMVITDNSYTPLLRGHWYWAHDTTWESVDQYLENFKTYNDYVCQMHELSGLTEAWTKAQYTLDGEMALPMANIEQQMLEAIAPYEGLLILAGSSVHYDHEFLNYHCPLFTQRLMHRHHDISSMKSALNCAKKNSSDRFRQDEGNKHRAVDDIENDIRWATNFQKALLASDVLGETLQDHQSFSEAGFQE